VSAPRQQINLYRPDAGATRRPFGADTLAFAAGSVLVLLLLIGGIGEWRVEGLQRAVQRLQQQQQAQQDSLRALGQLLPPGQSALDIDSRIQQLQTELAARERALRLLQQGAIGRTGGFAAQLAALARCPVHGLWLQRITISGIDDSMSLAGVTLQPDSVPRYLRALAGEKALSGLRFYRLQIAQQLSRNARQTPQPVATSPGGFTFSADGAPAAPVQVAQAQELRP
jgi:hypothetical protein